MQTPSFLDTLIEAIAAHTTYDLLQDLHAELRGKVPHETLAMVEHRVNQALDWVEATDQYLLVALDSALVDCQRLLRAPTKER